MTFLTHKNPPLEMLGEDDPIERQLAHIRAQRQVQYDADLAQLRGEFTVALDRALAGAGNRQTRSDELLGVIERIIQLRIWSSLP